MNSDKKKTKQQILYEEFVKGMVGIDKQREGYAFYHYKNNRRYTMARVPEWDKILLEERVKLKKLRFVKEYSLGYQKMVVDVELEATEDEDKVLEYMDTIGMRELNEMVRRIKESEHYTIEPKTKHAYTDKKDYTNNKSTYKKEYKKEYKKSSGQFGSDKQWKIINDERNKDKLEEAGIDPENIETYEDLQRAVSVCFGK